MLASAVWRQARSKLSHNVQNGLKILRRLLFDDDRMSQNFETKLRQRRYLANGYVNNWVACLPGLINKVPNADRVSRLWQH